MAYDEHLADRIRGFFARKGVPTEEKNMMGGLTFLVQDKMCVGIVKTDLMARIDPDRYEEALTRPGCRPMDFTGRPMKGYLFVGPEAVDSETDLDFWLQLALDFNPKAKASKSRKK